jgi:hypothetical protein
VTTYNAGQGAITKAMKSSGAKDFWSLVTILNMRRGFRCNVRDSGADCNPPAKLCIRIDSELPLTYNKVEVGGNQQLASLVEITGIEAQTIKELNPSCYKVLLHREKIAFASSCRSAMVQSRNCCNPRRSNLNRQMQRGAVVVHEVRRDQTLLLIGAALWPRG